MEMVIRFGTPEKEFEIVQWTKTNLPLPIPIPIHNRNPIRLTSSEQNEKWTFSLIKSDTMTIERNFYSFLFPTC